MEYVCTICCKEKREDNELLPATDRYISERIGFVSRESRRLDKPFLILSGKYGFIDSDFEIPWYDKKLEAEDVAGMVPILTKQLLEKRVSTIIFYGKPRTTPSWKPYYDALEQSCHQANVAIAYQQVDLD
jgi:hypothetical protein